MNFEGIVCPLCKCEYNKTDHLPRIIISCGDTLCTGCILRLLGNQNSFECPYDKTKCFVFRRGIETFPANTALLAIIDQKQPVKIEQAQPKDLCPQHHEELRLFCVEDKCRVCDDCLSNGHKSHHIKSFKKLRADALEEKASLESSFGTLDKYHRELSEEIEGGKELLTRIVKDRIQEFRWVLVKKEQELVSEIEALFNFKKSFSDSTAQRDASFKSYAMKRIAQLTDFLENGDFSNVFPSDTTPGNSSIDSVAAQKELEGFKQTVKDVGNTFNSLFASQIKEFLQIEFPKEVFFETPGFTPVDADFETQTPRPAPDRFPLFKVNELLRVEKKNNYIVISGNTKNAMVKESTENLLEGDKLSRETNVSLKLARYVINEENIRALFYVWRKLGDIACLKIDFSPENASDDLLLNILPVIFWKNKGLHRLAINLERCTNVSDRSVSTLLEEALPKLSDLTSLTLNLKSTNITDKSIIAFTKHMSPCLKNLHTLKLSLTKTNVSDQSISSFFVRMDEIKSLSLDLDYTKITDTSIQALTSNTLVAAAPNLEEFELGLSKTKVTDKSVSQMFVALPMMRRFSLSLGGIDINGLSMNEFSRKTLPSMTNLESLELYLWETKVSDQEISQLRCHMDKVKRFKLHLGNDNISDKSMYALNRDLMSSMRVLEDFELNLKNTSVTDEGVSEILSNTGSIKRFMLTLGSTNTTDKWLEGFIVKCLPKMRNLECLKLYLWSTKITDQSLIKLFRSLKNLSIFSLHLQDTGVTDMSIEEFIRNKNVILRRGFDELDIELTRTGASDKVKAEINHIRRKFT